MQVFLVLSKENCCRDKRARQFTKCCSKYKKYASSHVPIFNNELVFFFLYSAKLVNFCFRTSNTKWKISNFYAFGWINGVASFCEVNPSTSRCYKPRKKYIKFVVLYTNSFFWSPKWIWKNTRKFFPGNVCFFLCWYFISDCHVFETGLIKSQKSRSNLAWANGFISTGYFSF